MHHIKKITLIALIVSTTLSAHANNWREQKIVKTQATIDRVRSKLSVQKKMALNTSLAKLKGLFGGTFLCTSCVTGLLGFMSLLDDEVLGGVEPLPLFFGSLLSFGIGSYLAYSAQDDENHAIAQQRQAIENLRTLRTQYEQLLEELENEQTEAAYANSKIRIKFERAQQKLEQATKALNENTLAMLKKIYGGTVTFTGGCLGILGVALFFADVDAAESAAYFAGGSFLAAIGSILYYTGHRETENIKAYHEASIAYFSERVRAYTHQLAECEEQDNQTSNDEKE